MESKILYSDTPYFQNTYTQSSRIIHTPSIFARSSLLYLQEAGTLSALIPHVSSRTALPSYLFFIVTDGKGRLDYKGKTYELRTGDCVFIDCNEGYSQQSSDRIDSSGNFNELWSLSWIHFDGGSMSAIYTKYKERGGKAVFHCENPEQYKSLIRSIFHIASSDSYVRDMQIAEKLTALLTYLMEDAWEQDASVHAENSRNAPKRRIVRDVKEYIDENFHEPMSLQILADSFFINKEYLAKIFKETYGFTVNAYIAHVRVAKAKELLRFTDQSVEEIGAVVGIGDPNYFSRMFRRVEGVSPKKYRDNW